MYVLDGDFESEGSDDFHALIDAYSRYREYLRSNKASFPSRAYALAIADWRNARDDPRSFHDAWLESFSVNVIHSNNSEIVVTVKLLGPFHDGTTTMRYLNVSRFDVDGWHVASDLGDLVRDEIRLSDDGNVVHEIQWAGGCRWKIESADLTHSWCPRLGAS